MGKFSSTTENLGYMTSATDDVVLGNLIQNINTPQRKQKGSPVSYSIPLNSNKIIGREEDVGNLRRLITSDEYKPVAITALAITGKTSLAIYWTCFWSNSKTGFVTNVAFLDADTTESSEKSVHRLNCIEQKVNDMKILDIMKKFCNSYSKDRKLLIISNNLVFIVCCFLVNQHNIFLLVTMQFTEIKSIFYCLTPVSSKELIRSLFSQYFSKISTRNVSLLDKFQGRAFSIVQGCTYIRNKKEYGEVNNNKMIEEFIVYYERHMQVGLLDDFSKNYNNAILIALKLNIKKLKDSASKHVLSILLHMGLSNISANVIPEFEDGSIKCNLINTTDNGVLRNLKKYSLITEVNLWRRLNVHRLVQIVCRTLVRDNIANLEQQYIAILILAIQKSVFVYVHYSYYYEHVQLQSLEGLHKYIFTTEELHIWITLHAGSLIDCHIRILIKTFPEMRSIINKQTNNTLKNDVSRPKKILLSWNFTDIGQ